MLLCFAPLNCPLLVTAIHNESLQECLCALGAIVGSTVTITHKAPLGCPLIIQIGEGNYALRKKDIAKIQVCLAK